jgi:pilus assembly protein Flp/PilA
VSHKLIHQINHVERAIAQVPLRGDRRSTAEEQSMQTHIMRFIRDESGATAIEYGLIAAGIAVAIIATVQALGSNLNSTFTSVSTALK